MTQALAQAGAFLFSDAATAEADKQHEIIARNDS
jgi:hypothetical protein